MKHRITMFALLVLALALTGCGQSEFHTSKDASTGEITIHAENSSDDVDNGLITLEEDQVLVFSPAISEGAIHVKVTKESSSDMIVFEADISGNRYRSENLEPGNYQLFVTTRDGATGTLHVFPIKEEDLEKQNTEQEDK